MKLLRLFLLIAFVAPIVPASADLCCPAEADACSAESSPTGELALGLGDACGESESAADSCQACALCHASFLAMAPWSVVPRLKSIRTAATAIVPDAAPVLSVLTPPPSLA